MSQEFDAKLVINTAEAIAGIKTLDQATLGLDVTLRTLDATLKANQSDLSAAAESMTKIIASERAAAAAVKDREAAQQSAARTAALEIKNNNAIAESAAKVEVANARAAVETAKKTAVEERSALAAERAAQANSRAGDSAAVRNDAAMAISGARVDAINAQREVTETRLEQAQNNRASSEIRLQNLQEKTARGQLELNDHLSNSRYLLYDVGATYGVLAGAMEAIPAATAAVASSYQTDFAQVLRVTDTATTDVSALRDNLKGMAVDLPVSFSGLSQIASLGSSLGIQGADNVTKFTDAVAKFSASTAVGVNDAATAFGRLSTAFPKDAQAADFFNKIGSSIAQVGAVSVATDPEVVAVLNQIGPLGNVAGFTAEQMVGLAGGIASVKLSPELARGAFQKTILDISSAANQGGVAMQKYAGYLHMSGDAAATLYKQQPGEFFQELIKGVHDALKNGQTMNDVFDKLGVTNIRQKQFVIGLANGYDSLAKTMGTAKTAWDSGTFLDTSSAAVFSTVASKIKELGDSLMNLGDSIGGPALGAISHIIEGFTGLVSGIDDAIKASPQLAALISIFMTFGAVAGVLLAVKSAQAFVVAGLIGFQQVAGKEGVAAAMSFKGALQQVAVTMLMLKGETSATANELVKANGAMGGYATGSKNLATRNKEAATAAGEATTAFGRLRSGATSLGAGLLGMVGGPIEGAILALTMLTTALAYPAQKAAELKDSMKGAMDETGKITKQGLDQISSDMDQIPNMVDSMLNGGGFATWGKSIRDVAKDVGISSADIQAAATGSKDAVAKLQTEMNNFAVGKGFKDAQDLMNAGPKANGADFQLQRIKDFVDQHTKALNANTAAANTTKVATAALGGEVSQTAVAEGDATQQLDKLTTGMETAIKAAFGLSDAQGAAQAAIYALGQTLAKSTDFSNYSEGGRANLKNLEDAFVNQGKFLGQQVKENKMQAQQASADYIAYVDGLLHTLASKGVDTSQIKGLADQVKTAFNSQLDLGTPATVKVAAKVDTSQIQAAQVYLDSVKKKFGTTDLKTLATISGTAQVRSDVSRMQQYITAATGKPYVSKLNADTSAHNKNVQAAINYTSEYVSGQYSAEVGADTAPAINSLQQLAQFAASVVNAISDGINGVLSGISDISGAKRISIGHVGWGDAPTPAAPAPVPTLVPPPAIPAPTPTPTPAADQTLPDPQNFGGVEDGYNNVADAAKNAGSAGKQAGQDMAKGLDEATVAANDYGDRLKTSMQSAYDHQYGLQTATDAYYTQLNAIAKKRQDDLNSIKDLIQKQRELNDAMNKDLVDANKAKIEQQISLKYGETARAADYGNQAQTALDNAAAKKKEMDADAAQQKTLQDGIGNLQGYTQAAIDNRTAVRDLESKMIDMVSAYAKTGASQSQVEAYTARLTGNFQNQVVQLGFSRTAVNNLTGDMGRYTAAVARVPYRVNTNVTTSGTGPAAGALNAVRNAANSIPRQVTTEYDLKVRQSINPTGQQIDGQTVWQVNYTDGTHNPYKIMNKGGQVQGFADGGLIPGQAPSDPGADNLFASVDGKGLIKVRSREFIMQQPAVDYWGTDFMNAINNMKMPHFNMGGSVGGSSAGKGGGPMLVELTAENLQTILRAADRDIHLYTDDVLIAQAAGRGNTVLATKGFN